MVQKNDNKNVSGDGKKTYKNNLTNSKKTRMKKKKKEKTPEDSMKSKTISTNMGTKSRKLLKKR
jgi:hypothetical protein